MNLIKFLMIVACFMVSMLSLRWPVDGRDARILCVALGLTVVADFFMVIERNYEAGLLVFICVQLAYNARYGGIKAGAALVLGAALFVFARLVFGAEVLVGLAVVYAALFAFSLSAAARRFADGAYPYPNNWLVMAGMISYAVCDIFVAVLNSGTAFAQEHACVIVMVIWIFYIPGKFMLALSGFKPRSVTTS